MKNLFYMMVQAPQILRASPSELYRDNLQLTTRPYKHTDTKSIRLTRTPRSFRNRGYVPDFQ